MSDDTRPPQRIQLRRTKGWRKPEGAVVVARPSKWGNPFTIALAQDAGYLGGDVELRVVCVEEFRAWLRGDPAAQYGKGVERRQRILSSLAELRGRDLACWCPLEDNHGNRMPCHADVLLELANPGWTP